MMRDDIEQFKRELRSYKTYKKYISKLKDDLLVINSQLIGLRSPNLNGIPSTNKEDKRLDLFDKKSDLESKLSLYKSMILLTDSRLLRLDKVERDILTLVYMENVSIKKIARTFYMSEASVFRWINQIIEKALN